MDDVLLENFSEVERRQIVKQKQGEFIEISKNRNISSIQKLKRRPRLAMSVDKKALEFLFELEMVTKITLEKPDKPLLNESIPIVKANDVWNNMGLTGEGQTIQDVDEYYWDVEGGTIESGGNHYWMEVKTDEAGMYDTIPFIVKARFGNLCGVSDWLTREGYIIGGTTQKLSIAPNPANTSFTVSENEAKNNDNVPWILQLLNFHGVQMVNVTSVLPKTISVVGFQPGIYI